MNAIVFYECPGCRFRITAVERESAKIVMECRCRNYQWNQFTPVKTMGRPITMAFPLAEMAEAAGGVAKLAAILGVKSPSTIRRWSNIIYSPADLPPGIQARITAAAKTLLKGAPSGK